MHNNSLSQLTMSQLSDGRSYSQRSLGLGLSRSRAGAGAGAGAGVGIGIGIGVGVGIGVGHKSHAAHSNSHFKSQSKTKSNNVNSNALPYTGGNISFQSQQQQSQSGNKRRSRPINTHSTIKLNSNLNNTRKTIKIINTNTSIPITQSTQRSKTMNQKNNIESDSESDDDDNYEETLKSQALLPPPVPPLSQQSRSSRMPPPPRKRSWMDACIDVITTPLRRGKKPKAEETATVSGGNTNTNTNTNNIASKANVISTMSSKVLTTFQTPARRNNAAATAAVAVADNIIIQQQSSGQIHQVDVDVVGEDANSLIQKIDAKKEEIKTLLQELTQRHESMQQESNRYESLKEETERLFQSNASKLKEIEVMKHSLEEVSSRTLNMDKVLDGKIALVETKQSHALMAIEKMGESELSKIGNIGESERDKILSTGESERDKIVNAIGDLEKKGGEMEDQMNSLQERMEKEVEKKGLGVLDSVKDAVRCMIEGARSQAEKMLMDSVKKEIDSSSARKETERQNKEESERISEPRSSPATNALPQVTPGPNHARRDATNVPKSKAKPNTKRVNAKTNHDELKVHANRKEPPVASTTTKETTIPKKTKSRSRTIPEKSNSRSKEPTAKKKYSRPVVPPVPSIEILPCTERNNASDISPLSDASLHRIANQKVDRIASTNQELECEKDNVIHAEKQVAKRRFNSRYNLRSAPESDSAPIQFLSKKSRSAGKEFQTIPIPAASEKETSSEMEKATENLLHKTQAQPIGTLTAKIPPKRSSSGRNERPVQEIEVSQNSDRKNKMLPPNSPADEHTPINLVRKEIGSNANTTAPKLRVHRRKRSYQRPRTTQTRTNDDDYQFTSSRSMLGTLRLSNLNISSDFDATHMHSPPVIGNSANRSRSRSRASNILSPSGPNALSSAPKMPDLDDLRYRPVRKTLALRSRPTFCDIDTSGENVFDFSDFN